MKNTKIIDNSVGNFRVCMYKSVEDITRFIDKLTMFAEKDDGEIARQIISDMKQINSFDDFIHVVNKYAFGMGMGKHECQECFIQYGHHIPNKEAYYDVFKDCLCSSQGAYYNALMEPEIISEIRKHNHSDTVDNAELIKLLDADGYLTVYHGHCKKTLRNSNSWTIKKDIAHWFGNRNANLQKQDKYYVVTGKVKLSDIITYITDRQEYEVLVLNKDVKKKTKEFFDKQKLYKIPTE